MPEIKEYTKEIEDLFLQIMVSDPESYIRCKGIISKDYFDDVTNKDVVQLLGKHTDKYTTIPTFEQIKALTGKNIEKIDTGELSDWFLDEFESFCRHKALRNEILNAPDLLTQHRYGEVEKKIKEAVQIGLVKDLGTDYFADPMARLNAVRDNSGTISTGWKVVDDKLYGGFNRGEITIFAGQSGAGKSLFLQNLSVNWAQMGFNVVYITLELSEKLTAMRIDAMVTGYGTKEIMKNIEDVAMRVRTDQKKHKGSMMLKQLPNGCTVNDIRAYVKEYEVQTGIKVDAILVDYLDLMAPAGAKVDMSNLFVKDKYISEELRNLAIELDTLMVSASQLNRGSYEEIEFDPSHMAGGISKVNTADNVVGIFTTMTMKESGRYQLQFMKTRSSSGVGSKVDLAFSMKTLRITDLDDDEDDAVTAQTKNIVDTLKKKSVINSNKQPAEDKKVTSKDIAGKGVALRNILKKLD